MRWRTLQALAIGALAVLAVAILASSVPPTGSGPSGTNPSQNASPGPGGGQLNGSGGGLPFQLPLGPLFVLVIGFLLCGALVGLYRVAGRTTNPTFDPTDTEPSGDPGETVEAPGSLEAVADAAGRTADRIEEAGDVELENEVYSAWQEMTTHLAVPNRHARTAGEFEAAAISAGMDASHVHALTRLFEDVRYGEETPTAADEDRAVELLREIESTYGEQG